MRNRPALRGPVFAILLTFFLLPAAARAGNVTVGCPGGSGGTYTSITDALNAVGQTGRSTIIVTGTCTESVSISDALSITIFAATPGGATIAGGATIVGPQDNDAFDIFRSKGINLQNLEISGVPGSTVGGGGAGVFISQASDVHIVRCNIHNNENAGIDADTGSVVVIRGTTIQNNTPNDGLDVFDNSTAVVRGSTIQDNGDPGVGSAGVFVGRNSVVVFRQDARFGQSNLVQNNANIGIQARNLSNVLLATGVTTIQGHLTNGIILQEGSHLQVNGPSQHLIQGNGSACPHDATCGGIFATQDSTVDLTTGIITGNQGSGVSVQQGSNVQLDGTTISNNSGDGVHLQWISIGSFLSGITITGNGGASISCDRTSLALGDLSAFSKLRCEDVDKPNGQRHSKEGKNSRE